jgi:hypothetical protein
MNRTRDLWVYTNKHCLRDLTAPNEDRDEKAITGSLITGIPLEQNSLYDFKGDIESSFLVCINGETSFSVSPKTKFTRTIDIMGPYGIKGNVKWNYR